MAMRGGRLWLRIGGVAAVAVGAAALAVWAIGRSPAGSASASASSRVRAYGSFQSCLLTGARGVADPTAGQVWAGMEDASLKTGSKVSYLAVPGPATTANATSFVGSLLVRNCGVIVALGAPEQAAALADAPQFPDVRFVIAEGAMSRPVAGANVAVVSSARSGLRDAVRAMVAADVQG
jgi:basic membrane lipoprotein Med (substrate-binding protein (PBP1-ABC) superfamily)